MSLRLLAPSSRWRLGPQRPSKKQPVKEYSEKPETDGQKNPQGSPVSPSTRPQTPEDHLPKPNIPNVPKAPTDDHTSPVVLES